MVTLPASRLLQSYDKDLSQTTNLIQDIIQTLSEKRSNCETCFFELFNQSKIIMNDLDIDIKLPRISKRQINRSNTPAQSTEEYYRRVLFIPLLENILEDLKSRKHKSNFFVNDSNTVKCYIHINRRY